MIGNNITGPDGKPLLQYSQLSPSTYQPSADVIDLFARVQRDYQQAYNLQHRPFREFDGLSLLERSRVDQETFGAYVGAQWVAEHKRWRWRGRKNTARNKLIGILAHLLAGMLYPMVYASNQDDEPDKMAARVMRILIQDHLRKAGYEMKFLYMVLSALVNPAVLVEVDYLMAMQRIKEQTLSGGFKVTEAVDQFLSGLNLNLVPIDQLLLGDFYINDMQRQPYVIRIDRISWDQARKIYGTSPNFQYVAAGKTRVFLAGQEHQTLFDIEWTEADRTVVQVLTAYYRDEDVEAVFVGGVFMGNETDVYNSNPFHHRRLSLLEDEWKSIPIYPFAKSYYEPIDPTGRFTYGKSGAFKEYWDDATQNKMHQLLVDGTYLDVIKPMFLSGVAKADSVVLAPGTVVGMPQGSTVTPFSLGPNLPAALQAMEKQETDMSESTQDKIMQGMATPGVTATQSIQAQNQARLFLGVFGAMVADLVKQVGELVLDCTVQHTVSGELDASIPSSLNIRYRTILSKSKDKGKDVTNRVVFKSNMIGKNMTLKQVNDYEWKLWKDAGGQETDQRIYHVNPYKFARMNYSMYVDPDQIINHAMGNDRQQKLLAFQMLTDPRVAPFTDQKNVVDDFIIEEFADGDPDRYRAKGSVNDMMGAIMGGQGQGQQPTSSQKGGQVDSSQLSAPQQMTAAQM